MFSSFFLVLLTFHAKTLSIGPGPPIDVCEHFSCSGHGDCEPKVPLGAKCNCWEGYYGEHCENRIYFCKQFGHHALCANIALGTYCEDLEDTKRNEPRYKCHCAPGYTGRRCDLLDNIDCEKLKPCRKGGRCISTKADPARNISARFTCICPRGYSGKRCEIEEDECAREPNRCTKFVERSLCINKGEGVVECHCPPEPCVAGLPCYNGGTCLHSTECACQHGFVGPHCEFKHDPNRYRYRPSAADEIDSPKNNG